MKKKHIRIFNRDIVIKKPLGIDEYHHIIIHFGFWFYFIIFFFLIIIVSGLR